MSSAERVSAALTLGERFPTAWAAFKTHTPILFVGGLIRACVSGGGGGGGNLGDLANLAQTDAEAAPAQLQLEAGFPEWDAALAGVGVGVLAAIIGLVFCVGIAVWLFRSWYIVGWYRTLAVSARGGTPEFGGLFSGGDRFVSQLGISLLSGLVGMGMLLFWFLFAGLAWGGASLAGLPEEIGMAAGAVALLVALPGVIYVALGLQLGELAVAIDGDKAFDGLVRGWELARGARFSMVLWWGGVALFQFGSYIAGICVLCIGVLFTMPVAYAICDHALVDAYLRMRDDVAGGDAADLGPPDPLPVGASPWTAGS